MIGIHPEKAREVYQIPPDAEAWTAMAIGYKGDPVPKPPHALKERDLRPRQRKPAEPVRVHRQVGTIVAGGAETRGLTTEHDQVFQ